MQVGDFGLSRIKCNTLVSGGVRGTLPWMAPELLNGSNNRVSEKVRVIFSFSRIIIIEANISVEAYMVITSFKLSFLCLGWCLLIWYSNVGNHHRRRAICQHALWCYHRYDSHLASQTISNFSGSILSSNLLKRFHAGIDYVSLI